MEMKGLLNYKECDKAVKISENLTNTIMMYKGATTVADKMTFFCMAAAYAAETSWLDEGADARNCENNKRGCGRQCFKDIKKEWEDFIKDEGAGEFDANSSIGEVSRVLLSREKIKEKNNKLDNKFIELTNKLRVRDSVERDLYLICCGVNLLRTNPDYSSPIIDKWISLVKNNYGVDISKTRNGGEILYNISVSANADTRGMTV